MLSVPRGGDVVNTWHHWMEKGYLQRRGVRKTVTYVLMLAGVEGALRCVLGSVSKLGRTVPMMDDWTHWALGT